jgi:hypothetical protein
MAPQKKNRSLFASFLKSESSPGVAVAAGWRRLGEGQGGCTSDQQQDVPRLATQLYMLLNDHNQQLTGTF